MDAKPTARYRESWLVRKWELFNYTKQTPTKTTPNKIVLLGKPIGSTNNWVLHPRKVYEENKQAVSHFHAIC